MLPLLDHHPSRAYDSSVFLHERAPPDLSALPLLHAFFFFFNDRPPPEIYPLSLHDPFPISFVGIAYGASLIQWILKLEGGSEKMKAIAKAIQEGANPSLNRQYRTVAYVAAGLFVVLWEIGRAHV